MVSESNPIPPENESTKRQSVLMKLLPWLVSVGCVVYIGATTDLGAVRDAIAAADMMVFWASIIVIFAVGIFPCDSIAIWRLFNWYAAYWSVQRIRLGEIASIRGANYLLGVFNYNVGTAGMALYLKRTRGVPFLESLGALFLMGLCDMTLVALFVLCGAGILGDLEHSARLASFAVLMIFAGTLLYWRAGIDFLVLGKLRHRRLFLAFREARLSHYLKLLLMRVPMLVFYTAMQYFALESFGIHIPFARLLVYVPIQMLIAGLPISISGIGTVQVTQRVLYEPYASTAAIDAYAVAIILGFMVPRLLVGLAFVRKASRDLAGSA